MTEKELRQWMSREKTTDSWYVSVDGKELEETMRLEAVFQLEGLQPDSSVLLLHVSQVASDDPPWVELDPTSELTPEARESFAASFWSRNGMYVQIVLLLIVVGVVLAFVLKPDEPKPQALDSLERVFQEIENVESSGGLPRAADADLPELKIEVAYTERHFYLSNISNEDWPAYEIILDGPDGYRFEGSKPLPSTGTEQIPIRHFMKGEESLQNAPKKPKTVTVSVPGYRTWESELK